MSGRHTPGPWIASAFSPNTDPGDDYWVVEPCEPTADEREEHGLEDGDEWYRRTALIGEDA